MEQMTWPEIKRAIETGFTTAVFGVGLVAADCFAPGYLGPTREAEMKIIFEKGMPAITSNGVLGDPRTASAEKGEVYLERLADFLVSEIGARTAD
jgi:creatinine amidohydrolase/Fe(II)-dependent formamide hydrolase-like protein